MQVGIYADGRPLNYDEVTSAFDVGRTPVTLADVVAYDQAGQVQWLSDDLKAWGQALAPGLGAGAQPDGIAPDSGGKARRGRLFGFRSRTAWKMVIASVYYAMCGIMVLGAFASVKAYATSPRDVVLDVVSYLLIVAAMLSPAFLLSDFGYREKLPLFKRRKLAWSAMGLVVVFLLLSVTVAFADSLHSQPYKVAAAQEQVELERVDEAEAAAEKSAEASATANALKKAEEKRSAEASKAAEAKRLAEEKRSAEASKAAEAKALADAAAAQAAAAAAAQAAADKAAADQAAAAEAAAVQAAADQAAAEQAAEAKAEAKREAAEAKAEARSSVVYITKTGSKYHADGCRYLRQSQIESTLSEAKSRGLSACSVCNP